jgi:hypothetical protein
MKVVSPHFPCNISTFSSFEPVSCFLKSDVSASKTSYKKPAFHKTWKAVKALKTLCF